MRNSAWIRPLVAVAASAAIAVAPWSAAHPAGATQRAAKHEKVYSWTFETDTLGQVPGHARSFGGTWKVLADSIPESKRFIRQSEGDDGVAFHYLNFTRPTLEDLDASVRFRIVSGDIDPTAGILFQMDSKGTSGYLLRVSGRTNELIFHYLLRGKRRDLRFAGIDPLEPGTWHTISVVRRGTRLRVSYDGAERMSVRDELYSKGTVGVWTEDDTVVDFAELTATAR